MYIVGIDIAKKAHQAQIMTDTGAKIGKAFKVLNTNEGFRDLQKRLTEVSDDPASFTFGMEATGHYWLNLYTHLTDAGCTVYVINPIQSDALRGLYIRKTKNDTIDACIIADVIRMGHFSDTTLPQEALLDLRDLSRQRFYLVDTASDLKRKVITMLDRVFPEYDSLFSDVFGKTSMDLLAACTTPEEILAIDSDKLCAMLQRGSRGRFGGAKAEEIRETAKNSFAALLSSQTLSLLIKQMIEQIRLLEQQIGDIEVIIAGKLAEQHSPITTIPGIGNVLGAAILSEIGDITRFSGPEKLAAFAGIDPSVYESGQFRGTHAHMSKRGSPYLRRALWLAATSAILTGNPELTAFYEKKRAQGKNHLVSIGYICRKIVNIIFAVLTSGSTYIPAFPQEKTPQIPSPHIDIS